MREMRSSVFSYIHRRIKNWHKGFYRYIYIRKAGERCRGSERERERESSGRTGLMHLEEEKKRGGRREIWW